MASINYTITPYPEPARPIGHLGSWGWLSANHSELGYYKAP